MLIHLKRINPFEFRPPNSFISQTILNSVTKPFTTPQNPNPNPQNPTKTLTKPQLKALVLSQYSHGNFSNLLSNVIALPHVLLTACQNLTTPQPNNALNSPDSQSLLDSVSRRFDIEEMGRELCEDRFDVEGCCVTMVPSRKKGENLVLPNLKLKVLIEAIRMVLEIVYDERFLTFSYGGRVGMGRHTAIRGFPQESGLSSILINIYLNGFDKEIQDMRLRKSQENPKFESEELVSMSRMFYKPVKMFVVRYLDEILVITSGSKMLTMDLKNWALKYLEGSLELKVDKMKTAIHSAVSENISFLGMELQAVPPSVLHPPMTEKAMRARKKYLRQKEVRALELKNARERNRKKLGMKILQHVFKKLKQSDGFKFEFQIENKVREIFTTWADEVVQNFLGSLEERWEWHRKLTAGDFLSLRHIRDQLPQELVEAYDKFQEQVDKYLSPVQARKALEKEERRMEEEEERKYAKRTVEDLTRLCVKVDAPIELVRKAVKMAGFTNSMGRPRPIKLLIALEDTDIIKWYAGVGRRWLDFFCCCHNFKMVKIVVTYHLRFSCILTLAEKHESTKLEAIKHYTKDLKVSDLNGNEEVYFPTEREVKMMGDQNLSDPRPVDGALSLALIRLAYDEPSYSCIAHFCDRMDTVFYRVRLLQNRLNVNPSVEEKWVSGMGAIHESLNRKCLPLCSDHINDLYTGKITLQDIDCTSFVDVD
uniref:Reverse transcriptase domain-containing protein n=1 Tax=Fagus sylvatica TaxID=28930 RepID=A0A2N9EY17_FAGSY